MQTRYCDENSVRLCALSRSHFLIDFHQNWHRLKNLKSKKRVRWGQHRTTPFQFCPLPIPILGQVVLKIHANINNPISALNVRESPTFSRHIGNWGRGTRWWCHICELRWPWLFGRSLAYWFLTNVNSCSCSLYVVVRPSVRLSVVCRLSSVTFVHPTQPIEIFGNVSRSDSDNVRHSLSLAKIWRIISHNLETVQDRR